VSAVRAFSESLRALIAANLSGFVRRPMMPGTLIPAAVAAVIVPGPDNAACFVLTRRASRPGRHAGQWALPGGRIEDGENATDAALRELGEEVGIVANESAVLGILDDYETRSGFVITPVVVWVDYRGSLHPDPREVAATYRVPLTELEAPEVPVLREIPESPRPVIAIPLPDLETLVHAPTAAILYQLREVALAGRDTRVADYEQPVFAWR
jgi:8-oxo-dGTP pyrophosphatase MutT (NUDIX family)